MGDNRRDTEAESTSEQCLCGYHPSLELPVRRRNVRTIDIGNGARTAVAHDEFQLALEDFDHTVDSSLAEGPETPQERPADTDGLCSQRESFENIGSAPKSAVDKNGDSISDFGDDFGQRLERRSVCFGRTP